MSAAELARQHMNTACVDCGKPPHAGGMRCLPCFQRKARKVLPTVDDARTNTVQLFGRPHLCVKHHPSVVCYIKCRCRCDDCRKVKSDYTKERERMRF